MIFVHQVDTVNRIERMSTESKAELGVEQEGSTARTEAPATNQIAPGGVYLTPLQVELLTAVLRRAGALR